MSFGARVEIRLDALKHNFDVLKGAVPGSRMMVAVKANAYGHGLVTVARTLSAADAFAVARLSEAVLLRQAGITQTIVLLGGVSNRDELSVALAHHCAVVIHSEYQLELLEAAETRPDYIWLKIDTGMNRLGIRIEDAGAVVVRLRRLGCDSNLGLMTHFANADDVNDPTSTQQLQRFRTIAEPFGGDVSVANSAAMLGWQTQIKTLGSWNNPGEIWSRPGLALYGVSPLASATAADLDLRPVMQFGSTLIAVKSVRQGEAVGYGGHWLAPQDSVLGIVAAGYGDGYSRFLPSGTPMRVNGRQVPLAGVISMDLCAVDLGPNARDVVGDPVILWGESLPVEEVAQFASTTAYPLLTGVRDREKPLT